ncbi:permease PerM [Klebsiella pneumoniae]|uniref:Permease PerM n=1 Tax=Klebsiella pneumoniae TaxID=573 RepID=A0A2X3ETD5_KLEPN|nr:permease PerM [Klebsiella pneumoniae]
MFFFSGLLARCWWLSCWPICWSGRPFVWSASGLSRTWATSLVLILFVGILLLLAFVVLPVAWQQGSTSSAICRAC